MIQTGEKDWEAVVRYKELGEVERGLCSLQDVWEMRPLYHLEEK